MAENLGDALLIIRTDDSQFVRGVAQAEGKATKLGVTFDRTSGSSQKLSRELSSTGNSAVVAARGFERASTSVTKSAGMQRAGMQQLSFQIADVGASYAVGIKPMVIFAQQGTQVIQALALMTGGAGRLAGFLTGGWGFAIMAAVSVVGILAAELLNTADAMEEVEQASDGLADAQSVLGEVFDLTTGKIKDQNAMLRLNAMLLANNLKAEAMVQQVKAGKAAKDAGSPSWRRLLAGIGRMGGGEQFPVGRTKAKGKLDAILNAKDSEAAAKAGIEATRWADNADFSNVGLSREEFVQAISNAVSAKAKGETAEAILESLETGVLHPMFREEGKPGRKGRAPKDRSAQIENRFRTELARMGEEELRARLELTTSLDEEEAIRMELLGRERAERERQIKADKELSEAQRAELLAGLDTLYGPKNTQADDGTIVVRDQGLLGKIEKRRITERELAMANDSLAMQAATLDAQASIETNLDKRDQLERRALGLQQEIERNLLEQDIANGRIADADAARAALAEQQAAQRQRQLLSQRGPLEQYRDEIRNTAENMDREIEAIEVRGLQSLNDELTDAITGAKSLGEAFSNVADQIIADLVRIAVQQMIIAPLANMLFPGAGFGGSGGGFLSALFGGGRAEGGPVSPGRFYAVNERSTAPGFFFPIAPGTIEPAGGSGYGAIGAGRSSQAPIIFDLRNAVVTQDLLAQMNAISRENTRAGLAMFEEGLSERVQDQFRRKS